MNHWTKVCRSSTTLSKITPRRTRASVHETQAQEPPTVDELYFDSVHVDTINSFVPDNTTQTFVRFKIGTSAHQDELKCKVDTGAEGNILPLSIYQSLQLHTVPKLLCSLIPPSVRIIAYGGTSVKLHGTCRLGIRYFFISFFISFHFNFFKHGNPVHCTAPFSGGRAKTLTIKLKINTK